MLILGVDFETTGLNTQVDNIIEVGAVLWETERQVPLELYSSLVKVSRHVSYEITEITGILNEDVLNYGVSPRFVYLKLLTMLTDVQYIVAHNGTNFDKPILESELKRHEMELPPIPWIDTMLDIPYPSRITTRKLSYLATEHGFLNPFAHRSLSDVLTMLKVLSHYDINNVISINKEPNVTLVAEVKKPWLDVMPEGKKQVDLAKARGYRFNGGTKQWQKIVKENSVDEEKRHGEFHVRTLET